MRLRESRAPVGALLALLLVSCGATAPGPISAAPTVVELRRRAILPFVESTVSELPHVAATISGVGEVVLLVDTGAAYSWIDVGFAKDAGMPRHPLGATLVDIQGDESDLGERTSIEHLSMGSLIVRNLRPPLVRTIDPGVQGCVGQDILRRVTVVLDGPGGRLILSPESEMEAALGEFFLPGGTALSYTLDWSREIPVVRVAAEGLEGHHALTIDTGTAPMTVSPEFASAAGLEPVGRAPRIGHSFGGGETNEYEIRDLVLENLTVTSSAVEAPHSSLGWGVLREFITVFPRNSDQLLLFFEMERK